MFDYDADVLADPASHRREVPVVDLRRGQILEVPGDGWIGEVVALRDGQVVLRDRRGRDRQFALDSTFYVNDRPVRVVLPERPAARSEIPTTRSGSTSVTLRARVARGSRIWVEGIHDAELLELIWGDDLRAEGVVVEPLSGIDDLEAGVATFAPDAENRLGILVDHLVPGSKERRIADRVRGPHVLVTGHPFVDVWAAVKPEVAGLDTWPTIPVGVAWKEGICRAVGAGDPATFWRGLLSRVSHYTDLDRSLVGAVEQLIDFVTEEPT